MSIYAEHKHGMMSDEEYWSEGARINREEKWYEEHEFDEYDEEEEDE